MKDRPILYSAPMVCATLDGSKTQTRRVFKLPLGHIWDELQGGVSKGNVEIDKWPGTWHVSEFQCPYGQPGDRLWGRETFYAFGRWETRFSAKKGRDEWTFIDLTRECGKDYRYAATDPSPVPMRGKRNGGVVPGWWKRPAIFMPRWASRITLEITGVRVERLQDISEADAIAEGCTKNHNGYYLGGPHKVSGLKQMAPAVSAYRALWGSINGPTSWDANPWVWVVEFKVVKP